MVTQTRLNTESRVKGAHKNNLVETILSPMVAVYHQVSGPPWTDHQRRRRASIEASVQSSVSVNPYHLTHWRKGNDHV